MRRPFNAVNYRPEVAPVFGQDPNNPAASIVHDAWLRVNGFLVRIVGGGNTDPTTHYHGDVGRPLQDFAGSAAAIGNASAYRTQPGLAQDGGPIISDPVRRVLLNRMRAGDQL